MKILIVMCCLIVAVSCASGNFKFPKRKKDPYADFAGDKDLEIPDEDEDKPPTDFKGNVQEAKITAVNNKNYGKGKFKTQFETQNGISISQVGKLKDNKTFVVMGSYSYTGADGRRYRVKYTADELGYHPITELEVDIPELNLTKPTQKPFSLNFPKLDFEKFKNKNKNSDGNKGNTDQFNSNYQKDRLNINDGGEPNVKDNNSNGSGGGSNGSGGGSNGNGFGGANGGKPSSNTYLPPKGYLPPPGKAYLPPQGFKPPTKDFTGGKALTK